MGWLEAHEGFLAVVLSKRVGEDTSHALQSPWKLVCRKEHFHGSFDRHRGLHRQESSFTSGFHTALEGHISIRWPIPVDDAYTLPQVCRASMR